MTIGEIAGRFGLATHVLRHWESMGLLDPSRDPAGRRRYGHAHLVRVAAILRAKEAGLSLEDIRAMLGTDDPAARRAHLERHRAALRLRLDRTRACLDLVECALDCDHEDLTSCPRFRTVIAERITAGPSNQWTPPTTPAWPDQANRSRLQR